MKAYRDKRGNIWVEGKGGYTRLTEYDVSADHIDEGPIPPKRRLMYGLVELVEAPALPRGKKVRTILEKLIRFMDRNRPVGR
jgi:hypothetical protein